MAWAAHLAPGERHSPKAERKAYDELLKREPGFLRARLHRAHLLWRMSEDRAAAAELGGPDPDPSPSPDPGPGPSPDPDPDPDPDLTLSLSLTLSPTLSLTRQRARGVRARLRRGGDGAGALHRPPLPRAHPARLPPG